MTTARTIFKTVIGRNFWAVHPTIKCLRQIKLKNWCPIQWKQSKSHGCTFHFSHLISHNFLNKTFEWLCVKLWKLWMVKKYNFDSYFTKIKSFLVIFVLWTNSLSENSLILAHHKTWTFCWYFKFKFSNFSNIWTTMCQIIGIMEGQKV